MWYDNSVGDTYFDNIYSQATQTLPAIRFRTNVDGTTNSLVNAMTIVNNGNVGIGTTAPGSLLDVAGDAHFQRSGGTSFNIQTPASDARLVTGGTGPLILDASSNDNQLYLTTTGNVGIGTTAPTYKLDVNGSFRVQNNAMAIDTNGYSTAPTSSTPWNVFRYSNPQNIIPNGDFESWTAGVSTLPDGFGYYGGVTTITRESAAANKMQGQYSAKIVSVAGTYEGLTYSGTRVDKNPDDTSAGIYTVSFWYKQASANTQTALFGVYDTAAATYLFMDGLTKDDAWHWYTRTFSIRNDSDWSIMWGIAVGAATPGDTIYLDQVTLTKGSELYNFTQSPVPMTGNVIRFGNFSNMGGNVGIGTTGPTGKLYVDNIVDGNGIVFNAVGARGDAVLTITNDGTLGGSAGVDKGVVINVSGGANIATMSALNIKNGTTPILWAGISGNVGIGTTNPYLSLDVLRTNDTDYTGTGYRVARFASPVAVNADQPGVELGYDTTGGGIIAPATQTGTTNFLGFWTYNSGWAERMRLTKEGYLGIGTTLPSANLQIVGSSAFDSYTSFNLTNGANDFGRTQLRLTGRLQDTNDGWQMNSRNAILFAVNANAGGVGLGELGVDKFAIQYNMVDDKLGILSSTGGTSPLMVFNQNGNVGIGTTDPGAKLHVAGVIQSGIIGVAGSLQLARPSDGAVSGTLTNEENGIRLSTLGGGSYLAIQTNSVTDAMRIIDNGSVGIGTTAPGAALDVNGTIRSNTWYKWEVEAEWHTNDAGGSPHVSKDGVVVTHSGLSRGINTYVFDRLGNLQTSWGNDVYGDANLWNTWATAVNARSNGEVIVVISDDAINPVPLGNSAETLLRSLGSKDMFEIPGGARYGVAFAFIKGNYGIIEKLGRSTTDRGTIRFNYQDLLIMGSGKYSYSSSESPNPQSKSLWAGNAYFDGNVGIGTTGPGAKLEIGGTSGTTEVIRFGRGDGNRYNSIYSLAPAGSTAGSIDFRVHDAVGDTSQATVMTLLGNGNVGIGTTNPSSKLSVSGRISGGELGNSDITRNGLSFYVDFNNKASHSGVAGQEAPTDLGPNNYSITVTGGENFEYKDGIGTFFFDNSVDHLQINNYVMSDTSNTYEAWVRSDSWDAGGGGWDTIWDSGTERPLIGTVGSGSFQVYPDGTGYEGLSTSRWYHLVVSYASDDSYNVYVNGKKVGTNVDYSGVQLIGTHNVWLGGDHTAESLNGWVAVARMYDRQLTDAEVLQNYNAEVGRFTPTGAHSGLTSYYGNVGIGTTEPQSKLEINSGAGNQAIRITSENHDGINSVYDYPVISFHARKDSLIQNPTAQISITDRLGTQGGMYQTNVRTSDILFKTAHNWDGTNLSQFLDTTMAIVANQAGGSVGIGTTGPESLLHLSTPTSTTLMLERNAGSYADQSQSIEFRTSYATTGFIHQKGEDLRLGTTGSTGGIKFYTYSANGYANEDVPNSMITQTYTSADDIPKMTILSGGNVGIGTTAPAGKLEVSMGTGSWDTFVVKKTPLWGDGTTEYVTIGSGGATGIMISNPHIVWNAGNSAAALRMGRSGGVSTGAYYEIGTGANDAFFIAKNAGIANSQFLINSSGYVGIGTTSPQAPLNIYKAPVASTYVEQFRIGGTDNYPSLTMGTYDAYDGYMATSGNDLRILSGKGVASENHNIHFYTSFNGAGGEAENHERMTIGYNGNVGIGTTAPGAKLDVRGNDFYVGPYANTPAAYVIYEAEDLSRTGGTINVDTTASNGSNWGTNTNTQLYGPYRSLPIGNYKFVVRAKVADATYTGGSMRMYVIGTGISTNDRYVKGIDFSANNTWDTFSVPFRVTAATAASVEFYVYGLNAQQIYADYVMIVPDTDSQTTQNWGNFYVNGNVGIGTTAPGTKLDVYNTEENFITSNQERIAQRLIQKDSSGGMESGTAVGLAFNLSATTSYDAGVIYGKAMTATPSTSGGLTFQTNNAGTLAERMRIDSVGNVGIGTTRSLVASWRTTLGVNGEASSAISMSAGDVEYASFYSNAGESYIGTTNASPFNITTNGSYKMTILSGGNVGIGTTAPNNKLQVAGGISVTGAATAISSGNGATLSSETSYDQLQSWNSRPLYINPLGNNVIFNRDGGNVGIGTTAPNTPLTVKGSGTGYVNVGQLSEDTSYGAINFTTSTLALANYNFASSGSNLLVSRPSGYSIYFREANVDQMAISTGGNVGIGMAGAGSRLEIKGAGTTSATSALNVTNSTPTSLLYVRNDGNVGIGTTAPGAKLHISKVASGAVYQGLILQNVGVDNGTAVALDFNPSTVSALVTNNYGGRLLYTRTGTNGQGTFSIQSSDNIGVPQSRITVLTSGSVGIGTTGPLSQLSVGGVGSASYGLYVTTGVATGTYSVGSTYGMQGISSASGYGVYGEAIGGTGVFGQGGTDGVGVMGSGSVYDFLGGGGEYAGNGNWTNTSDRNLKENFTTLDDQEILSKIISLPMTSWNYKTDKKATHIGPIAQDFYAIFGLGDNDVSISTIDPAGIALVGIQALNKNLEAQKTLISAMDLNLGAITGTIVPTAGSAEESFMKAFFANLYVKIGDWLGSADNGIKSIFARKISTKLLCVSDDANAETCIVKSQLDSLLTGSAAGSVGIAFPPAGTTTINPESPVITLTGSSVVNLNVGDTYTEEEATVIDNKDTFISVAITGVVDTATEGTYTITYDAVDTDSNNAIQVVRTVIVSAVAPVVAPVVEPAPAPVIDPTPIVVDPTPTPAPVVVDPTPVVDPAPVVDPVVDPAPVI